MNDIIFKSSYINPKYLSKFLANSKKLSKGEKWQQWNTFEKACSEGDENQVKCWQDFEYYRKHVCKHETFPHQKTWEKALNTGNDSTVLKGIASDKNLLILSPRGSSKSTFIIEWLSYQIGKHIAPWYRIQPLILYISYDMTTAQSKSRQLKSILTTRQYNHVFPWIRPSKSKWGEKEWSVDFAYAGLSQIQEQYVLAAGGLGGAINSRRSTLVIVDDIYKSAQDAQSDAINDKLRENWNSVVQYTQVAGARAIAIGTRFSSKDMYNDIFVEEKNWQVIEQSAILQLQNGTEVSYWEEKYPVQMLQKERAIDPVSFSFQRQNKLIRINEQSISPELIIRDWLPTKFDTLCLGVDLSAGTKQSNDYTAMVLSGRYENKFYVIDCWEYRALGNLEKLRAISELWENWNHLLPTTKSIDYQSGIEYESYLNKLRIWFDSSAYGLSFEGDFKDYKRENKLNDWEVFGLSASGRGSKLERLRRHTKLFEDRQIKFNMFGNGRKMEDGRIPFNRLIQQLTDFGNTRHDDLADAFDLCIIGLRENNYSKLSKGNY